jgi:hypothetical protein
LGLELVKVEPVVAPGYQLALVPVFWVPLELQVSQWWVSPLAGGSVAMAGPRLQRVPPGGP